jgi:hypothetical protein
MSPPATVSTRWATTLHRPAIAKFEPSTRRCRLSGLTSPPHRWTVSLRAYLTVLKIVVDSKLPLPPDEMEAHWQRDVASVHR